MLLIRKGYFVVKIPDRFEDFWYTKCIEMLQIRYKHYPINKAKRKGKRERNMITNTPKGSYQVKTHTLLDKKFKSQISLPLFSVHNIRSMRV